MHKIEKISLKSACKYINEQIDLEKINVDTYISTENMLPNKSGVVKANKLPNTKKVPRFLRGDILISNIRPYFKKIWHADNEGGCSNDVLVIRSNNEIDPKYLYYILSNDDFFNYATATAKGTKMPRGDKNAIMEYSFPLVPLTVQRKVVAILNAIDSKINVNNKLNDNLIEWSYSLFKEWFIDYNPKYIQTDRKQTDLGKIPFDWEVKELGALIQNFDSRRVPLSSRQRENKRGKYPYYGATSVMDYIDEYIFDDTYVLMGEDGSVIKEDGTPYLQYIWGKSWVNNHAHVLKGKEFSTEILYLYLLRLNVSNVVTGAVQSKINQRNLNSIKFACAPKDIYLEFDNIIQPIFKYYKKQVEENCILLSLRDILLPKLVSGEIDLDNFELDI